MKVSKIVVLAALTASFSHHAVAKDAMYKWCAEEPAAPVVVQPQVERINLSAVNNINGVSINEKI